MVATPTPLAQADFSNVRLLATDIDGTLTKEHRFSSVLLAGLERLQAAGVPVILATGRSAGWVEAIATYLPVAGVIGENGGCYFSTGGPGQLLGSLKPQTVGQHREKLADCFWQLQGSYRQLQESADNRWRLTDWTFELTGLDASDLWEIAAQCEAWGWNFTYSSIQGHIKLPSQNKASGIQQVLKQHFAKLKTPQVLTVGDSPNDGAMFDASLFPLTVGVANIHTYLDGLEHPPQYITLGPEVAGFSEVVDRLLAAWSPSPSTETSLLKKAEAGLGRAIGYFEQLTTDS